MTDLAKLTEGEFWPLIEQAKDRVLTNDIDALEALIVAGLPPDEMQAAAWALVQRVRGLRADLMNVQHGLKLARLDTENERRLAGRLAETPDWEIRDYGDHPDYPDAKTARPEIRSSAADRYVGLGREGMVTVWDAEGHYLGCVGIEMWQRLVNRCAECGGEGGVVCPDCGHADWREEPEKNERPEGRS